MFKSIEKNNNISTKHVKQFIFSRFYIENKYELIMDPRYYHEKSKDKNVPHS